MLILLWIIIVLSVTLQPEKFKFIVIPAFIIICLIFFICLGKVSIVLATDYNPNLTQQAFRPENTFRCIGIYMYSYSAIGTLFSVRNTMKYPQKMPKLASWGFSSIFVCITASGFMCYWAFGNEHLEKNMLYYFAGQKLFDILNAILNIVLCFWMPFVIVSTSEQFEHFEFYKNWLNKEEYWGSKCKVITTRITTALLIGMVTFVTSDVITATTFAGEVLVPICSMIIPIVLNHSKAIGVDGVRKSLFWCFHDFVIFFCVLVVICVSLGNILNFW